MRFPAVALPLSLALAGCAEGDVCVTRATLRDVVNQVFVGATAVSSNSRDIDGDGELDNAFGGITHGLRVVYGLNIPGDIESAVTNGETLEQIELTSSDAGLTTDACASITVRSIDSTVEPFTLGGAIVGGVFTSKGQRGHPVPLHLPLGVGYQTVLPIDDVQIKMTIEDDGHLTNGTLTGAIASSGFNATFTDKIVDLFNATIQADATGTYASVILANFDNGGTSCDAVAANAIIEPCELTSSPQFAPDIALFDMGGNLAPDADRLPKDAVSFGIAFSAAQPTN